MGSFGRLTHIVLNTVFTSSFHIGRVSVCAQAANERPFCILFRIAPLSEQLLYLNRSLNAINVWHTIVHEDEIVLSELGIGLHLNKSLMHTHDALLAALSRVRNHPLILQHHLESLNVEGFVIDQQYPCKLHFVMILRLVYSAQRLLALLLLLVEAHWKLTLFLLSLEATL